MTRRNLYRLFSVLAIIAAVILYRWFFYYFTYTRDAYVDANVADISTFVPGHIKKLHVLDNYQVKKGEPLITLDKEPYQYALAQTQAKYQSQLIQYDQLKNQISAAADILTAKQADLEKSQQHLVRIAKLVETNAIAQIDLINIQAKVKADKAAVAQAQQELTVAKERFNQTGIQAAKAALDKAKYDLQHTTIYAPEKGYVTNFNIRVGDYIKVGDPLFALVETNYWWVAARFRETVVRRIHVGDKAIIFIDMYPWHRFKGRVESIGWGINRRQASATAATSTLLYLKPTEDWIRIAQRFPVRVTVLNLNPNYPLRVGASAEVYISPNSSHDKQ